MRAYDSIVAQFRTVRALQCAMGLMNWDRQVLMPPGGGAARTEHVTRLAMMEHRWWSSDETARLLEVAEQETAPDTEAAATLRVLRREVLLRSALPAELVQRKSRVGADGYEAWKRAKSEKRFAILEPFLAELFAIARETSQCRAPKADHPYDPLIDLFDEGNSFAKAHRLLDNIKQPVIDLLAAIRGGGKLVDDSSLRCVTDQASLRDFAQQTAAQVGFDFSRGRLDICANAFCSGSTAFDVRMTTRASNHIKGVVSSSLHEMGHGLYQQGDRPEWTDMPLAGGASLALHESQSRLWENIVGRSRPFWSHFYPSLQSFQPQLAGVSLDTFWRGINKVEPTFIRVGSDELSYNLHIIVRFELEVELVTGRLATKDLPDAWNEKYRAYLGIVPPDDALGCLQDVHWSRGSVGYFPTYALGNIIGGAVWKTLRSEIGDVDARMAEGDFSAILAWLTEKIYRQGQRYTPADLLHAILPTEPDGSEWLDYAQAKYGALYGLS
ncbi:MAG: carboxypeptidase M32 [Fimbriimonadaceae bacterium]